MRINFDPNGQRNILNVERINQSLANSRGKNQEDVVAVGKQERRDKATLSPMGKATSMLERLMKQKQQITETKNELIGKTLENGGDIKDIKTQLEAFEEQLKSIEEQINATLAESLTKEEDEEKKTLIEEKEPITKEEADAKKLENVAVQASNVQQSEELFSMKNKMEAKSRVLNYELEVDKARGTYFNDGTKNSKEKMIEKLENGVEKIYDNINDTIKENTEITDENANIVVEENIDGNTTDVNENNNTEEQPAELI